MNRSLNALYTLFFTDLESRLYVVDVTIKDKAFRFIEIYVPNQEAGFFFDRSVPNDMSSNFSWRL